MKRRRSEWLIGAVCLFVAAGWLMWRGEHGTKPARAKHNESDFPSPQTRRGDRQREDQRLVLPPLPQPVGAEAPERPRDPVLAALAPAAKQAFVFEAAAIRDSPLGAIFLRCAIRSDGLGELEKLKQKHGVDVMRDVDRVAMSDQTFIVSGSFGQARWADAFDGASSRTYGSDGVIYESPPAGAQTRPVFATWGRGMLLVAPDAASVEQALDRLEGRAPTAKPPIASGDAYGEAYGVLSWSELAELFPADFAAKVRAVSPRMEVHVDARDPHDVLMVADVTGSDTQGVEDLGKSLGAALAVARVKARADGDDDLVELLDVSHVTEHAGRFRTEVALPLDFIEKKLCDHDDAGAARSGAATASVSASAAVPAEGGP
jgi:hypothetical protein